MNLISVTGSENATESRRPAQRLLTAMCSLFALAGLALTAMPVHAAQPSLCPTTLSCTANRVAFAGVDVAIMGGATECVIGQPVQVAIVSNLELRSNTSYDAGIWVASDGGNIASGTATNCEVAPMPFPFPNAGNTATALFDSDGDVCGEAQGAFNGDIVNAVPITNDSDGVTYNDSFTVMCDPGPNGQLQISGVITWGTNAGGASCDGSPANYPVSQSQCSFGEGEFDVDVVGRLTIVKDATVPDGTDFNFSWAGPTTSGNFTLDDANPEDNDGVSDTFVITEPFAIDADGTTVLPTSISVTETLPAFWELQDLVCVDANSNPVGYGVFGSTLNINLTEAAPDVTCTFVNNPFGSIALNKTAMPTSASAAGQVITYNFNVFNDGILVLTDVGVTDPLPGLSAIDCGMGNTNGSILLAPGDSVDCTATYTITQADMNAGVSIMNTATAAGTDINGPGSVTDSDGANVGIAQNPGLLLRKSSLVNGASVDSYNAVGQVVDYSYEVENTGNISLADPVTVSDSNEMVTCPSTTTVGNNDGFLDPDEILVCTAQRIISQQDINDGSVNNTATATAGGIMSNEDFVTLTANQTFGISLDKSAMPTNYDDTSDVISYNYEVENTGNTSIAGPVVITDDQTGASQPAPTCDALTSVGNMDSLFDPGEIVNCTTTRAISQADINAGSVTNIASAAADVYTSNNDTVTVNANQNAALSLDKVASPTTYTQDGDIINYSYTVTNSGNVSLAGPVTVADDRSADANQGAVVCPDVSTVGNNDANLDPGEAVVCTTTRTINAADVAVASITNNATASADGTNSNPDSETVTNVQNLDLVLDKSSDISSYNAVNQVITYSYLVTNNGNADIDGPLTIADDQETVTCPAVTTLAQGASETCTVMHTVTQADIDAGSLTNIATATLANGGSPVDSNQDSVTVNAVQTRTLSLGKSATPGNYNAENQVIDYSFTVTNTGNTTLAGPVTVTDSEETVTCPALSTIGNMDADFDPAEVVVCTAQRTISQADLDAGSVMNMATAMADGVNSNQATETINAQQNRSISLDKTVMPTTYDMVGDVLTYTFVIENTGNVTLSGQVVITDDVITNGGGSLNCPAAGDVLPGDTVTCSGSLSISQQHIDDGNVFNEATAALDGVTSNVGDANATAVLGNLNIIKDATGTDRAFDFTSVALGDFQITTMNGFGQANFSAIAAGTYDVAETVPTDWDLQSATCDNGDTPDAVDVGAGETVTCTFVNTERQLDVATLLEVCVNDAAYVDYNVTPINFTPGADPVTIRWITQDGNNTLAEELTNQPLNGRLLWPGTTLGPNGVPTDYPGWVFQNGQWVMENDGLRPNMLLEFEVNPTVTQVVSYPPPTPFCNANPMDPAPVAPPRAVPIPAWTWAVMLLTLLASMMWLRRRQGLVF